jgi:uncharacterized pyridoxamine 5'-phosphate oxidase family protein
MQAKAAVERDIRQLLQNRQLAVLSTEQQKQPYTRLVAFAVTTELSENSKVYNCSNHYLRWHQRPPEIPEIIFPTMAVPHLPTI